MGEVSITAIDVLVVIVLLVSAGFAMWRGLVSETFTIVDWVLAAFIAVRFTPVLQPLLRDVISPDWLEYIVVFIGTFVLIFLPLSILNHRLSEAVKKSEIGPVDRALGFVFGLGRGLVIVGLSYIAFSAMVPLRDHPVALTNARLYPLIRQTSEVLLDMVPGENGIAGLDSPATPRKASIERELPPAAPSRAETNAPARAQAAAPGNAKTYGANDRRALDRLIETTGAGQDSAR